MNFHQIVNNQKAFFSEGKTKDITFRKKQLKKLKEVLKTNEGFLYASIADDFSKSKFDTYTTELSFLYAEIDYFIKNLSRLAKPKRVCTNLANLPGSSKIYADPLGCCLVIGAWNYPYQLTLLPVICAMAAGNTVVVKPSEIADRTAKTMVKLISDNFPSSYLCAVEGGVPETTALLKEQFDKIFFTGSPKVGKIVYEAAAKNLTPVTLELGGKSPVIVTQSANITIAAKRMVWGKFLNAGQTCIAPDYVLVEKSVEGELLEKIRFYLEKFDYTASSEHYTQIINQRNFDRLQSLIDKNKIVWGGETNPQQRYLSPTILKDVSWDDLVMQDEIFGPILPVLTYEKFDDALQEIRQREKPLAAYLFTSDSGEKKAFCESISFGGGCINDTVMHLSNPRLPFGGIGNSGIGNYHGKYGFEAFSHQKSVLSKATWGEPDLKYPPYSAKKLSWIKKLLG